MNKIKQLVTEKNLSVYDISKTTGGTFRKYKLNDIIEGSADITGMSLNSLSAFARGLGVQLEDILNDFDLDGTSSQVVTIKRQIEKIRKNKKKDKVVNVLEDKDKFVYGMNLNDDSDLNYNMFKTKFDFINPKIKHDQQNLTPIYQLNEKYLEHEKSKLSKNDTLENMTKRVNSRARTYIVYTPIVINDSVVGGDLKMAITAFTPQGEFLFTEVYGAEFMDTPETKEIVYYKGRDNNNICSAAEMERIKKDEISELEFYNALFSQYWKYGLSK